MISTAGPSIRDSQVACPPHSKCAQQLQGVKGSSSTHYCNTSDRPPQYWVTNIPTASPPVEQVNLPFSQLQHLPCCAQGGANTLHGLLDLHEGRQPGINAAAISSHQIAIYPCQLCRPAMQVDASAWVRHYGRASMLRCVKCKGSAAPGSRASNASRTSSLAPIRQQVNLHKAANHLQSSASQAHIHTAVHSLPLALQF
jgi:hypothetical protein